MKNITKKIYYIQFSDELSSILKSSKKNTDLDEIYIAMSPEVQSNLKKSSFVFHNTQAFFGTEGHKDILKKSSEIFDTLNINFNHMDEFGVSEAYKRTLVFYFRFYLHYWLFNLYVVARSIEIYSPTSVSISSSSELKDIGFKLSIKDRILGEIVKSYVNSNHPNIKIEENPINLNASHNSKNYFLPIIRRLSSALLILIYPFFKRSKLIIFGVSDGYNLPKLIKLIVSKHSSFFPVFFNVSRKYFFNNFINIIKGKEFFFIPKSSFAPQKDDVNLKIEISKASDAIKLGSIKTFTFEGVDLKPILSEYLLNACFSGLIKLKREINFLHKILSIRKPSLVVSQNALGSAYALGELCAKMKIPGLLVSHGTHVAHSNTYSRLEWEIHAKTIINTNYPLVAAQSPQAEVFLKSLKDVRSKIIRTGPLIFASNNMNFKDRKELREKLFGVNSHKKIILHASTPKDSSSMRPWVYETIDEYISNINDVINAVDKFENIFLAIKFRPSKLLSKSMLLELIKSSDNCIIYTEGVFDEYLLASDLLVSYSSTAIEEALQNNLPVLQYDSDNKYMHIKSPTININNDIDINPIYYCGSASELAPSIKTIFYNLSFILESSEKWENYRYPLDDSLAWLDNIIGAND
jgi:hypothetical protein